MKEPGDKLSRRYFASLLGLGAVAAAMGVHAAVGAGEAVVEKAEALKMKFDGKWRIVSVDVSNVRLVAYDTIESIVSLGFGK